MIYVVHFLICLALIRALACLYEHDIAGFFNSGCFVLGSLLLLHYSHNDTNLWWFGLIMALHFELSQPK